MSPTVKKRSQNPVRGYLFIVERAPESNILFVFRRRELRKFAKSAIGFRVVGSIETTDAVPPKNKKEDVQVGGRFYKQATPSGVWSDSYIHYEIFDCSSLDSFAASTAMALHFSTRSFIFFSVPWSLGS